MLRLSLSDTLGRSVPGSAGGWRYAAIALRLVLGVTLLLAGVGKLLAPESFAQSIEAFRIVPSELVAVFACAVVACELVLGFLLVFGYQVRKAAMFTTLLIAVFTAATLSAMHRGLAIDCGCFSWIQKQTVGWGGLVRNVSLIVVALATAILCGRTTSYRRTDSTD